MNAEKVAVELARRYFRWIGPATVSEFQWFSGLGAKAAKAAIEPLNLEPVAQNDPRLMMPGDRERLETYQIPKQAQYAFVGVLDEVTLLKRNTKDLIDPQDLKASLFRQKGYSGDTLADLPSHEVFDR